ncbi:hypothetical protein LBMAG53_01370 [Planctomycetota bacterium]|nr:hypothetical protein LBMAG53_01370 [Planctomycetota bacterium]
MIRSRALPALVVALAMTGAPGADTPAHALAREREAQLRAAGHARIADLLADGILLVPQNLDAPQRLAALVALADAAARPPAVSAATAAPARPIDPVTASRAGARAAAILDGAPSDPPEAPKPSAGTTSAPAQAAATSPATATAAYFAPLAPAAQAPPTVAPSLPPTRVAIVGTAPDGKVDAVMLDAEKRGDLAFGQRWRIVRDGKALVTVEITRLSGGFAGCRPDPATWSDPPITPKTGDLAEFVAEP